MDLENFILSSLIAEPRSWRRFSSAKWPFRFPQALALYILLGVLFIRPGAC